ncbi:MAG: hypothetical protein ABIO05_08010, partial [Ferruginibacter sp.]
MSEPGNIQPDFDNEEKLMDYLNKAMPANDQHMFEKEMNDDAFMADAVEGLEQLNNQQNIPLIVQQLQTSLSAEIKKKHKRNERKKLADQPWVYFAIIFILFAIII